MATDVILRKGETQEALLKRFQRAVQMDGILREVKVRRFFVAKSEAARIKQRKNARRRRMRR